MKKNRSATQKKEKEIKQKSKKTRKVMNRIAMGLLVILLVVVIIYSIRSRKQVNLSDSGSRPYAGNAAAKVIISEFSDFQCPACKGAEPNMKQLLKDYEGKIKFVFYNYPLTQNHQWAMLAAEAAECANDQGKFWPYHDLLYDRQEAWSRASEPGKTFREYALELGLKGDLFNSCLDGEKNKSRITEDQDVGDALQIQSTPTIFVNQQRVIGGTSLFELKQAVDTEISLHS